MGRAWKLADGGFHLTEREQRDWREGEGGKEGEKLEEVGRGKERGR